MARPMTPTGGGPLAVGATTASRALDGLAAEEGVIIPMFLDCEERRACLRYPRGVFTGHCHAVPRLRLLGRRNRAAHTRNREQRLQIRPEPARDVGPICFLKMCIGNGE